VARPLARVQPRILARDEATCDARYLRMPPCAAESQGMRRRRVGSAPGPRGGRAGEAGVRVRAENGWSPAAAAHNKTCV